MKNKGFLFNDWFCRHHSLRRIPVFFIPSLFTFHFVLFFASCGSAKQTAKQETAARTTVYRTLSDEAYAGLSEPDRLRLDYFYQEACKQKILGNHVAAYDLYRHCLDICPSAPEVLFDLALYQTSLREDSLALQHLVRAAELDPENTHYKESLAGFYLDRNRQVEALTELEDLARLSPRRSDVLGHLTRLYVALNRPADAIRTLDRIEVLEGKMANVSYQKFSLYMQLKQEKKAFGELEALCREYPHEMSYRLAIGNQLLQAGRISEAQKVYDQVRKIDPDNASLKLSMLELYRRTGKDSLFTAMQDSLMYSDKTDPEMRVALLRDFVTDRMQGDSIGQQEVEQTFNRLDSLYPKDLSLLQLRAAYLATYDKSNDSAFVAVMDRVIDLEPENTQALFYLIQYYGQHKDFVRLESLCRRGVLTHPEELICHYYLGVACYQQDKKAEALQAFSEGIVQKTPESRPGMVADLYSIVGDLLHEMGRKEESYAAYDSCLVYQDDNASCLNNYAYFLSLDESQLDRAEEMSYRAIRLEPQNRTFLDTYAWILFMKGRYGEAQAYMDRVCPPDSADSVLLADPQVGGVVLEHAGDIAWMNDLPEQALRFWKLAEQAGGDGLSAVLPKKIKLKKYFKE